MASTTAQWLRYIFFLLNLLFFVCVIVAVHSSGNVSVSEQCCVALESELLAGACLGSVDLVAELYRPNTGWINALAITALSLYLGAAVTVAYNWVVPYTRAPPEKRLRSAFIIAWLTIVLVLVLYASAGGFTAYRAQDERWQHCFQGNLTTPPVALILAGLQLGMALFYFVDCKQALRSNFLWVSARPDYRRQPAATADTNGDFESTSGFSKDDLNDEDDTIFDR